MQINSLKYLNRSKFLVFFCFLYVVCMSSTYGLYVPKKVLEIFMPMENSSNSDIKTNLQIEIDKILHSRIDNLDITPGNSSESQTKYDKNTFISDLPELFIQTKSGKVNGFIESDTWSRVRQFLGFPYAKPPLGSLRFSSPEPSYSWQGYLKLHKHGNSCPQLIPLPFQSEDCLFLDIYTPTIDRIKKVGSSLPVLFWIHGGGFTGGSGNLIGVQNPAYIVHHKDVIVVSINYRLGPLGFLAGSEISGNMGLLDQQLALNWTRDNIAEFGGDPKRITIWGESAGAMSIAFHLTMPTSWESFSGAIMESPVLGIRYRNFEESSKIFDVYAERVGCSNLGTRTLDCLRSKSLAQLLLFHAPMPWFNDKRFLSDFLTWTPVIDGLYVKDDPLECARKGIISPKAKVMMGNTKDEAGAAQLFLDLFLGYLIGRKNPLIFGPVYKYLTDKVFKDNSPNVLKYYPSKLFDTAHNVQQIVSVVSDYLALCPALEFNQLLNSKGSGNSYFYVFEFLPQIIPPWLGRRCSENNACHGLDIPYAFHSLHDWKVFPKFTAEEHLVSHLLIDYLVDFAKNSDNLNSPNLKIKLDGSELVHDLGHDQAPAHDDIEWPQTKAAGSFALDIGNQKSQFTFRTNNKLELNNMWWMTFSNSGRAIAKYGSLRKVKCEFWSKISRKY